MKNTVFNCPSGSTTFRLFNTFLSQREILLETFVEALEAIKNLASVKALTDGYESKLMLIYFCSSLMIGRLRKDDLHVMEIKLKELEI